MIIKKGVGHVVTPNNTIIKNTNLNNVNKAGSERYVENSREETKEEIVEDEEDINDIRRKIKESLEDKGKCNFIKSKDSGNEKNDPKKNIPKTG
jgi:hypothetical protein